MMRTFATLVLLAVWLGAADADLVTLKTNASSVRAEANAKIRWSMSFDGALKHAAELRRPVMLVLDQTDCRWCDRFKSTTLSDPRVIEIINRDFVAFIAKVDAGTYPEKFWVPGTPGTWFLLPDGEAMNEPLMGSIPPASMLGLLQTIKSRFDRRYAADGKE